MFLNIITPCTRPEFLFDISKSINIPSLNYRWIVVCDLDKYPDKKYIPNNCEIYLHRDNESKWGFSQRNYAKAMVDKGHIYFNDDDTTIHKDLWNNISYLDEYDFISFDQQTKNNTINVRGNIILPHYIDMHNFIVSNNVSKNISFTKNLRIGDGLFAQSCHFHSTKSIYLNKILSTYNSLI